MEGVVRLVVVREAETRLAESPASEFGVIGVEEAKEESWALPEEKEGAWWGRRATCSAPVSPGIGIPFALVLVPRDRRRAARADG